MESVKEAVYARLSSSVNLCLKRKKGQRLVVLFALDEAQFLDRLIHPDAEGGGARYGLRVLRQLQFLPTKRPNGSACCSRSRQGYAQACLFRHGRKAKIKVLVRAKMTPPTSRLIISVPLCTSTSKSSRQTPISPWVRR